VGAEGPIKLNKDELSQVLQQGLSWAINKGYAPTTDALLCEEEGILDFADPRCVSQKALHRGLLQVNPLILYYRGTH